MKIEEFCQKVKRHLEEKLGEEALISIRSITKNNGIELHSVIVARQGRNLSPNIYLDDLYLAYEEGETFRWVMDKILQVYEESKNQNSIDMSFFLDYEKMKEQVVYKVISYDKNRELLKKVPHVCFLDMAIVFYCHVPQEKLGNATILIYSNHLEMWGVTEEQLYEDAKRNTERLMPPKLLSIEDMMREIVTDGIEEVEEKKQDFMEAWGESGRMFVLGNEMKLFGAAVMLYGGVLERIREKLGKNLFILPSSIHEVILVPDDKRQEAGELWKMVCDINATQVEPEEVLTDSVYYFSHKDGRIEQLF